VPDVQSVRWVRTAIGATCACLLAVSAFAQWQGYKTPGIPRLADGSPNLSAPAPKTADGKPDLSGIWQASRAVFDLAQAVKKGETVPFSAEGKTIFSQRRATESKDDPSARCLPTGLPVRALLRTPFKIIQTPPVMAILYESRTTFRQIMTDGRPLPADPLPTWSGYSIGKWEGDTLIVRSNGFRDDMWLDANGSPMTSAAKITERFRRPKFGRLDIDVTVDDPKAYTRPWTVSLKQFYVPDSDLLDYVCQENEKDVPHLRGQ
jgi:hypothetical protein